MSKTLSLWRILTFVAQNGTLKLPSYSWIQNVSIWYHENGNENEHENGDGNENKNGNENENENETQTEYELKATIVGLAYRQWRRAAGLTR